MNWLIWKELRLQWLVLMVGVFLLVVPYGVGVAVVVLEDYSAPLSSWYAGAALASISLSVLTMALLGGNAFACERQDRSAEFLAYQPISRMRIVGSKLVLPGVAMMVIWGINYYVLGATDRADSGTREVLGQLFIFTSCAFGVAWLISSFQSSPTFAVGGGFIAPLAIVSVLSLFLWAGGFEYSRTIHVALSAAIALAGLFGLVGGVWHYVRRVEP